MTNWEKLKYLFTSNRQSRERDMQEELESLRAMADDPRELGNLTLVAENTRAVWSWLWLEHLAQDVRYAFRSMVHNKAFTILAVLSLALGIGANTAIFSFMDSILLRPLPVPKPETLVIMKWHATKSFTSASSKGMSWTTDGSYVDDQGQYIGTQFPYPALKLFQDNTNILSSAFSYVGISRLNVTIHDESEAVKGQYVSGNYFEGMAIRPAAGRLIEKSDDVAGAPPVAVISHRLSSRRFGSAGQAIGQTIRLNNNSFTVVGVTPSEFFGAEPGAIPEVYVPMYANLILQPAVVVANMGEQFLDPNYYWIEIMGRLKPGVSVAQAQAALEPQFRRFVLDTTSTERQRSNLGVLRIEQGGAGLDNLRRKFAKPVYLLMVMVAIILLIACANIANLLLARAMARRREIAVRLSIGAGRVRLIRQLLTESVLLSCIGGIFALAFAGWGIRVLTLLLANGRENFTLHAELNWHVLGITLMLSIASGLLFGLVPALQATRLDVMPALKEAKSSDWFARSQAHQLWKRMGVSSILLVAQVAFSLFLLVAAGLFGRTLWNLHSIPLGFSRDGVLLFNVSPKAAGFPDSAANGFYEQLQSRLAQVPGVRSVGLSAGPLPSGGGSMAPIQIVGEPLPEAAPGSRPPNQSVVFSVGPQFFNTMQIPKIAGREFTDADSAGTPVAIINERLAQVFHLPNAVGRTLTIGSKTYEIVGVVRDSLMFMLKEELRPAVYLNYVQASRPPYAMTFEIRTDRNPLSLGPTVHRLVREIDSRLAVFDMKTEAEHIDQAISSEITLSRLCTVFAALALVISCVGLYGTVAFNVERRTSEIGIRMALGARAPRILWMVLREVLLLAIAGLAIGMPVVFASSRLVQSFLYGIEPNDPLAIGASTAILLLSGLIAGVIPASRAATIDPMIAVRHD